MHANNFETIFEEILEETRVAVDNDDGDESSMSLVFVSCTTGPGAPDKNLPQSGTNDLIE